MATNFDLEKFQELRYSMINHLNNDLKNVVNTFYTIKRSGILGLGSKEIFSPYLPIDLSPLCCFLESPKKDICENATLSTVIPGKDQIIQIGSNSYLLKKKELDELFLFYDEKPPTSYKDLDMKIISSCLYSDLTDLKYLGSDEFTNEIFISFFLDVMYSLFFPNNNSNERLNGYLKYHMATICNEKKNYGLFLTEYPEWGTLKDVSKNVSFTKSYEFKNIDNVINKINSFLPYYIIDFTKQISANLYFLQQKLHFYHGNLTVDNIFIKDVGPQKKDYISFEYEGMRHSSNYLVKIGNFSGSSINATLNGKNVRIYNKNKAAEIYYGIFPFKPEINDNAVFGKYFTLNYLITAASITKANFMGVPFYISWDTATFLISFLMLPEVFYVVFTNQKLRNLLFDNLWSLDDYSLLYKRIHEAVMIKKSPNLENIIEILKDIKIKCNLTKTLFDNLKNVILDDFM